MKQQGAPFDGTHYSNGVPTEVMQAGAFVRVLGKYFKPHPGRIPATPPGPFQADATALNRAQDGAVFVTWLGHSTVLFTIDGKRFLIDPVWYQRASPFTRLGPKRFFPVPVLLHDLPPIDYVLLSHDHYDHLDKGAIQFFSAKKIPVITMLGVGKRLRNWGVDAGLVTEMDWWETKMLDDGFAVTALPARHFSGRSLVDRFTTLWGSFAIKNRRHAIYCGADSGYHEGFKTIGETYGPFDLTMLEIGAYNEDWTDIHMGPEAAVQAHLELRGKLLLPIHWGTFALAFHGWKEPVKRMLLAAAAKNVPLLLPAPGQTVEVGSGNFVNHWWDR